MQIASWHIYRNKILNSKLKCMKNYLLLFLLAMTSCTKNNSFVRDTATQNSIFQPSNAQSTIVPAIAPPASAMLNGIQWYGDNVYCYFSTCFPNRLSIILQKHDDLNVVT